MSSAFVLFTTYTHFGFGYGWTDTSGPVYWKNISNTIQLGIAPGATAIHPGPTNELGILRFTAPTLGTYSISVPYDVGDTGNTSLGVYKNRDGSLPVELFYDPDVNNGPLGYSASGISLLAGDTVDLFVGFGPENSYFANNTQVNMIMTLSSVPEPGVPGLLLLMGAVATPAARWRVRK